MSHNDDIVVVVDDDDRYEYDDHVDDGDGDVHPTLPSHLYPFLLSLPLSSSNTVSNC